MKKTIYLLTLPLAVLALASCSNVPAASTTGGQTGSAITNAAASEKFQPITYGVAAGSNFLVGLNSTTQRLRMAPVVNKDVLATEIAKINPYLYTAEQLFTGELDLNATVDIKVDETAEFPYSMTLEGGEFKWKETALATDDHNEEEYRIEGQYTIDGMTYAAQGKREFESEMNETETEIELWVDLANGTYLSIAYETEVEHDEVETDFTYGTYNRMWDDDMAILEVEVGLETEAARKEASVEVTTLNEEAEFTIYDKVVNDLYLEYEFEDETTDQELEGNMIATIAEDGSTYTYKVGEEVITTLNRL